MDLIFLLIISTLIQFTYSQNQDNDGNDVDNDQDLNINAFGNVITPIKGNTFVKKNNGNSVNNINKNEDDEDLLSADSMPEMMNNVIGLAGLGSNVRCHHRSIAMRKQL